MMRYGNFISKLVSLLLVLGILAVYQHIALHRADAAAANEAAVAEAEAHNAEVQAAIDAMNAEESSDESSDAADSPYNDGTYEGTGTGFGGSIVVEITIEDGQIVDAVCTSHSGEDDAYYSQAEALLSDIVTAQSPDVDKVSGATFSSTGLLEAAQDALGKAVR